MFGSRKGSSSGSGSSKDVPAIVDAELSGIIFQPFQGEAVQEGAAVARQYVYLKQQQGIATQLVGRNKLS
jgi:hypothetical protein